MGQKLDTGPVGQHNRNQAKSRSCSSRKDSFYLTSKVVYARCLSPGKIMETPLVSVVLPTYNRAYCIERAVNSALDQTHHNVEILLIDDGSTDGTGELVAERYRNEPRLRYIHQPNSGVSVARNTALRELRGDFVAFLDSDDVWKSWKLELQLACLKQVPHAGMIWTEMEAIDSKGNLLHELYLREYYSAYKWFSNEQLFTEEYPLPEITALPREQTARLYVGNLFSPMIMGNLVHTPTTMVRRDRVEKVGFFNERLRRSGGDFDFHLRTCRVGPVAFVNAATIQYRIGDADQLTSPQNSIHSARNFLATIRPLIDMERDNITLPPYMIDAVLAEAHQWLGEAHLKLGELAEARGQLAFSLRQQAWQPRTWSLLFAAWLPPRQAASLRSFYRTVREQAGLGGTRKNGR